MAIIRNWNTYSPTYRTKEIKLLARWIHAGKSGTVVGLPGCGRSNLLGYLCHRPDILAQYLPSNRLPVVLIPIDFRDFIGHNISVLYRLLLRAFDQIRHHLPSILAEYIRTAFEAHKTEQDFFVVQSVLYDILGHCKQSNIQIVFVLDHFDHLIHSSSPEAANVLRSLRDRYRGTVSYLVGLPQEIVYFDNVASLAKMYNLLDGQVCWVGAMSVEDSLAIIRQETHTSPVPPTEAEIAQMLRLTGHFPALIKVICHWWSAQSVPLSTEQWPKFLLREHSVLHRLVRVWDFLSQEEKLVLIELQKLQDQKQKKTKASFSLGQQSLITQYGSTLKRLEMKGLCFQQEGLWLLRGELLLEYVRSGQGLNLGRIWQNEQEQILQGHSPIAGLTNLQRKILIYFLTQPHKKLSHTDIIVNAWPDDVLREGVTNEALYTQIKDLREKIEPQRRNPCYIIKWRGQPEGGYQFFPEGRPKSSLSL